MARFYVRVGRGTVFVRPPSARRDHTRPVTEPRPRPDLLLRAGRMLELHGDPISAVVAYRAVILAGEATSSIEARDRLRRIALAAWPGQPA